MSGDLTSLADRLAAALGEPVTLLGRVQGGDIAEALRARTGSGRELFVKCAPGLDGAMFPAEARGLRALAAAAGCAVPEVVAVGAGFLALAWVEQGRRGHAWAEALGRGLAQQHRATASAWGFDEDNFIGRTPQPNGWTASWIELFRERRLGAMHRALEGDGRCPRPLSRRLHLVRDRLATWLDLPEERPALLHGDLWSGNALARTDGMPILVDPAVYYGCREADLAMMELFGGFPARAMDAYLEAWPLAPGYADRRDLYNLYHVLNHALMFGGGYVTSADRLCARYVG